MEKFHPIAQVRAGPLFNPLTDFLTVGALQKIVLDHVNTGEEQAFALNQLADLVLTPEHLACFGQAEGTVVVIQQLLDPVLHFLDHHATSGGEHRACRSIHDRRVRREHQPLDMAHVFALYGDRAFFRINNCVQICAVH